MLPSSLLDTLRAIFAADAFSTSLTEGCSTATVGATSVKLTAKLVVEPKKAEKPAAVPKKIEKPVVGATKTEPTPLPAAKDRCCLPAAAASCGSGSPPLTRR